MKHIARFFALAASLSSLSAHAETGPKIESFSLSNGLEVVVIENNRIPAVSQMVWFRVGSADDPPGKSGLAHYHEHAMFLGTGKYPAGQFSEIVARHGGQQNAFTSYDTTSYFINIYKTQLPLAMELEADRMRGLAPTDADMTKEKQVIIEERRERVENRPDALLDEQINAALFRHHPYRIPVIGWMHEMEGLTKQDVLNFHQAWYRPNNAVLVYSGDVTAAELKPLVQKYFGGLPAGKIPPRLWNAEPPQNNTRRIHMEHKNVKQPQWRRNYMAASLGSGKKEDAMPLFVLAQLLGGKTGRLYQSLVVEQKLASSVDADYNGFARGPAEFGLSVIPEKDVDMAAVEKAVDERLAAITTESISDAEFSRAKMQLKAEAMYARDGLSGMARIMGFIIMAGLDKETFTRWPSMIDAVTKEQVVQAAKNTFNPNQAVTSLLLTKKSEEEKK